MCPKVALDNGGTDQAVTALGFAVLTYNLRGEETIPMSYVTLTPGVRPCFILAEIFPE